MIMEVTGRETIELTDPYKITEPSMKQKPSSQPITPPTKLHNAVPHKWEKKIGYPGADKYIRGLTKVSEPEKWEKNWS
jgi:hypothetical protein